MKRWMSGQALVEFAVSVPVLLLAVLGLVELYSLGDVRAKVMHALYESAKLEPQSGGLFMMACHEDLKPDPKPLDESDRKECLGQQGNGKESFEECMTRKNREAQAEADQKDLEIRTQIAEGLNQWECGVDEETGSANCQKYNPKDLVPSLCGGMVTRVRALFQEMGLNPDQAAIRFWPSPKNPKPLEIRAFGQKKYAEVEAGIETEYPFSFRWGLGFKQLTIKNQFRTVAGYIELPAGSCGAGRPELLVHVPGDLSKEALGTWICLDALPFEEGTELEDETEETP